MGKLLRILVVLLLLLAAAALALGMKLFQQREILKGRAQKLESAVVALGTTLEAEPASVDRPPSYPFRDISPTTSEVLDTPEVSHFWDTYAPELEVLVEAPLRVNRENLMRYYRVDPATGKPLKGVTDGEGTLQFELDRLLQKAADQHARLNETRQQLVAVRTELVDVISELNEKKPALRRSLKRIEDLEAVVNPLREEVRQLKAAIEGLNEEKTALENRIEDQRHEMAKLQETIQDRDIEIERLKKEIKDIRGATEEGPSRVTAAIAARVEPGIKGSVVAANNDWNFAVVEFTDDFLKEILGDDLSAPVPAVELMIRRPGEAEQFVTKIRLLQVRVAERLGVVDILTDWQQIPVHTGDVVFN